MNYFGARYLDPMLGMWASVDPARQFSSPYLYAGNGMNPIGAIDPDGNYEIRRFGSEYSYFFTPRQATFLFQGMQKIVPFASTFMYMTMNSETLVECSYIPNKLSVGDIFLDAISLLKLLKFIKFSVVGNEIIDYSSDAALGIDIASSFTEWRFENFMASLTMFSNISGTSIEDVKAKAAWSRGYGQELFEKDVEITNDVRHSFSKAYKKEFEMDTGNED